MKTNVRKLREDKKLSMKDLAKKLNIGYSTVSKYETRPAYTSMTIMKKVYDFFNTSDRTTISQEEWAHLVSLKVLEPRKIVAPDNYGPTTVLEVQRLKEEIHQLKTKVARYERILDILLNKE